ncbi:methionine synthase [Artemisia annua]|uniref:Methionine synthase n=1 Tax=Artemisia annua TaxID=35608 RepID=A0A2U1KI42_ARTAN|nr:methionine synthase [Artemisia annua]
MNVDVTTFDSLSAEELQFVAAERVEYGAGIGPGVYDINSPKIPSVEEIHNRINKMLAVLETNILWVNPNCGLKTREYGEVKLALENMVTAAKKPRDNQDPVGGWLVTFKKTVDETFEKPVETFEKFQKMVSKYF